jgi:hypothetical protein
LQISLLTDLFVNHPRQHFHLSSKEDIFHINMETTTMQASSYSKAALTRFLDLAEKQGLFNPNTLGGMRAAMARIFEDAPPEQDVREIDIEAAVIRYHNKHPEELSLDSLRTYESRLKRLIIEFVKYVGDPVAYKPYSRVIRAITDRAAATRATEKLLNVTVEPATEMVEIEARRATPSAMAMQYPLRDNFIAQVVLPRNMTNEEARRLCAFIRTLAVDFSPET